MAKASIADISEATKGLTAPVMWLKTVAANPDVVALQSAVDGEPGTWNTWTYAQCREKAEWAAAGLRAHGVVPGQRVLLLMRNRPDFHWFDVAAQLLRATPVSIYNSSAPEEIIYLAGHAEAEVVIVEDAGFLDRVLKARGALAQLEHVFVMEPPEGPLPAGVTPADELYHHGAVDADELAAAVQPSDLATLIYTSGTTGPPKGVMLSHGNIAYTVELLRQEFDISPEETVGVRVVSYLPMAHIAERMVSHYAQMLNGYTVTCCPDPRHLAAYVRAVHPEIIFGVPRVWEKFYAGVNGALAADPEKKQKFDEGIALAKEIKESERAGTVTKEQQETLAFLDAVAFAPVRALIGLDAVRAAVTGAAAIPREIHEWFLALGVPLSEVWGMSESSGPGTWDAHEIRPGKVGRAAPGIEVRLDDDGEVLIKGGNVFQGYLKDPEKTAEALTDDGWLRTGDIGELDDDGYLKIVDRKKELIITSGGKNISPANLEAALKTIPGIGQACAIGDQRNFISALLVLDPDTAPIVAKELGLEELSLSELAEHPDALARVQEGVDQVNTRFARVMHIRKFTLLGEEWLPDSDVLTPTSKLKRRGVHSRYADVIEAMYA